MCIGSAVVGDGLPLLGPHHAHPLEHVGSAGVRYAKLVLLIGRPDNEFVAVDGNGGPEKVSRCAVAGNELGLEGPGRTCSQVDICRTGIGASLIVIGGTDHHRIAVDIHGRPEAVALRPSRQVLEMH